MGPAFSKTPEQAVCPPKRASFRMKGERGTGPRIILSNKSQYRVSYSVLQEDKKRISAHRRRTRRSMSLLLKAGLIGGGTKAELGRNEDVAVETEETKHYLLYDHRMEPMGLTQDTEVPFPAGCQELRVYACFLEDGRQTQYKDKVYSMPQRRGRSVLVLTALSSNISPYRKGPGGTSADLGQPTGGCCKCSGGCVKTLFQDKFSSKTTKGQFNTV